MDGQLIEPIICENYLVKNAPNKALYIPNFITKEEEEAILLKCYDAPRPKWVQLSNRRLQNWGGLPHPKGMVAENIPKWLINYMLKIDALNLLDGKSTNHVLINEYLPGQGIMPHEDGPIFYPVITTITLGSYTFLDIYSPLEDENLETKTDIKSDTKDWNSRKIGSLLLEPRSLLVLKEDLYSKYLHGIAERCEDTIDESVFNINSTSHSVGDVLKRDTRVSLTIRYFPKVLKFKLTTLLGR